jgi:hypothetical protein
VFEVIAHADDLKRLGLVTAGIIAVGGMHDILKAVAHWVGLRRSVAAVLQLPGRLFRRRQ